MDDCELLKTVTPAEVKADLTHDALSGGDDESEPYVGRRLVIPNSWKCRFMSQSGLLRVEGVRS